MGARTPVIQDTASKYTLQRVRLNGDYDSGGAYWGAGEPLYWYATEVDGSEISGYLRARSRTHAKEQIRESDPEARFYR